MKIPAMPIQETARASTERVGTDYPHLNSMSIGELVAAMNENDSYVVEAVRRERHSIEIAIEEIVQRMAKGGRLIYVGAGTSGRLGVLDASECPPTFNADPNQVMGVIAGGRDALTTSIEGAEDSEHAAVEAMHALSLTPEDSIIGIAASGRTPFVIAAIKEARTRSCLTIGVSCTKASSLAHYVDYIIEVDCGPEILAGSTRLKAGTATKMILNMISTISMVKLGKVYQNLMIDMRVSNEKLRSRAIGILVKIMGVTEATAEKALERANGSVRHALVILNRKVSFHEAQDLLSACDNDLDRILNKDG